MVVGTQRFARLYAAARRAFTLVEILVVVVILGIVSAMIIPQLGSRDDLRTAAAARVVMSDLIYAQNLAISTQRMIYIRFSSDRYALYDVATGGSPIMHPVEKRPFQSIFGASGSAGLRGALLESQSFDAQSILAFDELGAPYSHNSLLPSTTPLAAAGTIVVASGSHRLQISVEPFTGEVTVAVAP